MTCVAHIDIATIPVPSIKHMVSAALPMSHRVRVAFICIANMCRSPAMHAVFQKIVDEKGLHDQFYVDSFALSSNTQGNSISSKMAAQLKTHGYNFTHTAQPFLQEHFDQFDVIIVATEEIKEILSENAPDPAKIRLLQGEDIPDPFSGGAAAFEKVFAYIEKSCRALFDELV